MKIIIYLISICLATALNLQAQNNRSKIISQTVHCKIDGNRLIKTNTVTLQINNRSGDQDAQIDIYYTKGDKISIDAHIEDMFGQTVRQLKKNEIKDRSAISSFSLYEDDFVKSFELKHNTYPYLIVYTTQYTTSKFLSVYNFIPTQQPVEKIKVIVETNDNNPIVYKSEFIEKPEIASINNQRSYTWEFSYKGYKPEKHASYYQNSDFPELEIQPININFGKTGSFESWKSYGNWYYQLNVGRDELPISEKEKINTLLEGIDDSKKKAQVLYKYLQDNTRYINVSIEYGGLQTYPAEYVCTNRYGDCKALSNYMKAMLKYVGIDSYYTPIYSSDKPLDVDIDFPSQISNHIILTIPFSDGDTTFLECTSKNLPFGYIHTSIQNRKAILVDKENSRLIDIPSLSQEDVLCTRNILVDLSTSIDGDINMSTIKRGYDYELFSSLISNYNKSTLDKYITNNILGGSFTLTDYKIDKNDRDSAFISLSINYKKQNLLKKYGNNITLETFPIYIPVYEKPEERKYDVQINYPVYQKDTITYNLHQTNIAHAPKDISIVSSYGCYSQTYAINNNKLYVYKYLLINAGRYPVSEYEEFYKFMLSLNNAENHIIIIETL